jgi:hypothetical protein
MKNLLLALVFLAAGAGHAAAQTDFTRLRLAPGDKVIVVDANGTEVGGHLTSISRDTLSIGKYEFGTEPGLKIERSGDSLVNGVAIGGGVGLLLGLSACGPYTECAVSSGVVWGVIGAIVDWAHVGRTTVYRVPSESSAKHNLSVAPLVTADRKGVGVSLSF